MSLDVVKWEYHAHRPGPSYYGTYRPTDMYVEHKNIEVEIKTPNTAIFDSMFSTKIFDKVIITRFYQEDPFLTVLLKQVVLDRLKMIEEEDNQEMFPKTILFLGYEYIQVQSFMNPYGETPLGNDLASCKLQRGYQTQSNSIYVPPPPPPEPTPQEIIMPPLSSKKDLSDSEDKQAIIVPEVPKNEQKLTSERSVYAVKAGVIFRVGWQYENDHDSGLGWRLSIDTEDGYYDQYGHMDPDSTLKVNTKVEAGDYIGKYADPTNGSSTGPHVHYERRKSESGGEIVDPGNTSPVGKNGKMTADFEQTDHIHKKPHQGTDWVSENNTQDNSKH